MRRAALLIALCALAMPVSSGAEAGGCPGAATIRQALGLTIGRPASVVGPGARTCSYSANGVPTGVVLVFRRAGALHGTPLVGLGDAATTSTSGAGPFAAVTVSVRRRSRELDLTAVAPLARVEALARRLLRTL
jgi:hypothetical protein